MWLLMLCGVMSLAMLNACCFSRRRRGFGHGALHRAGDAVGVEDHLAVDVARGAADGLHQRGFAAQEAFLVGVENGDEAALGNVEAFAQQVDADQHVERAQAQVADDLDALHRVDVGVHVAHAHALFVHVFGKVLGHALGEHGDERAEALLRGVLHFGDHVVDLAVAVRLHRAHFYRRIDQAGGADHLLGEHAAGALELPRARRGRDVDRLRAACASHSSNLSGRLSMHEGRRKP